MKLTLSIPRLGLRLWQSHLLLLVIGFVVFATNDFTRTNPIITALATVFVLLILFILWYNEANRCGKNDVNQSRDGGRYKGLLAGLLADLPGLALWVAACFFTPPQSWYRLYMVAYEGLLSLIGENAVTGAVILLPMPLISFLGYVNGRRGFSLLDRAQEGLTRLVYEKKK